jgi:hypothetical protein
MKQIKLNMTMLSLRDIQMNVIYPVRSNIETWFTSMEETRKTALEMAKEEDAQAKAQR